MTPQQAYAFVESQAKHIERKVYRKRYASIQYRGLVPIDTSASDWAKGITYYSADAVGSADFLAGRANDFPLVNFNMAKNNTVIDMLGLGYDWSLEEISTARMTGNLQPLVEKASMVRRIAEEKIDDLWFNGYSPLGWHSMAKPALVRRTLSPNNGTGNSRNWKDKTAELILKDINTLLQGVFYGDPEQANDTGSETVEFADTLLLSPNLIAPLNEKVIANTAVTAIEFIKKNNVYTMRTGRALKIGWMRGLETAGSDVATTSAANQVATTTAGNPVGRVIAYRRDPEVLKLHMPMPLRFLPTWQKGPMTWVRGAIFRLGGLEIRLPGAMRVLDAVE